MPFHGWEPYVCVISRWLAWHANTLRAVHMQIVARRLVVGLSSASLQTRCSSNRRAGHAGRGMLRSRQSYAAQMECITPQPSPSACALTTASCTFAHAHLPLDIICTVAETERCQAPRSCSPRVSHMRMRFPP